MYIGLVLTAVSGTHWGSWARSFVNGRGEGTTVITLSLREFCPELRRK